MAALHAPHDVICLTHASVAGHTDRAVMTSEASPLEGSSPLVDYVIKFDAVPSRYLNRASQIPEHIWSERVSEYHRLVKQVRSVGLRTTSRPGPAGSGSVLVFVHATTEALGEVRYHERCVFLILPNVACTTFCMASSLHARWCHRIKYRLPSVCV